jgi:hypothetical protein
MGEVTMCTHGILARQMQVKFFILATRFLLFVFGYSIA